MSVYIYIYIYIYICMYVCNGKFNHNIFFHIYIYIYIYVCVFSGTDDEGESKETVSLADFDVASADDVVVISA